MSENEIKPVAWQWQDEIGRWNPVQYEKAMQRGVNGYKVRALFDQSAIERLREDLAELRSQRDRAELLVEARGTCIARVTAERDAAVADARRWNELCRQIDAGTFPIVVIEDAMEMGSGALELQVDASMAEGGV